MQDLDTALAQQAPPQVKEDPSLHELPPLVVDGIPTPVEKMTQAQLRAFIPLMLKYSTGRGKPGWGKESTRPLWWPKDLPWANVRSDARTEEEKQKVTHTCITYQNNQYMTKNDQVSWTHALRQIVINCYRHHNREDLLPAFSEDEDNKNSTNNNKDNNNQSSGGPKEPKVKHQNRTNTIHTGISSIAPVTLTTNQQTVVTSLGDPNSHLQTVNV